MYCSSELPCAYPAVLCLVCLFLMLSGLFQIDVSVVMAVSLAPQEAILTSQRSQQLAHQADRKLGQSDTLPGNPN